MHNKTGQNHSMWHVTKFNVKMSSNTSIKL